MTVEETIDRTLFEYLRIAVVDAGLLPDILLYSDELSYSEAIANLAITLEGKACTEVFGVGMPAARGRSKPNKIIIDRIGRENGNLGGSPVFLFVKNVDETFNKYKYPDLTENLLYSIRIECNSIAAKRKLGALVTNTLGIRGYLPTIQDDLTLTGESVLVTKTGGSDISNSDYMEEVFFYTISDLWLTKFTLVSENIPKLSMVQGDLYSSLSTNLLGGKLIDL